MYKKFLLSFFVMLIILSGCKVQSDIMLIILHNRHNQFYLEAEGKNNETLMVSPTLLTKDTSLFSKTNFRHLMLQDLNNDELKQWKNTSSKLYFPKDILHFDIVARSLKEKNITFQAIEEFSFISLKTGEIVILEDFPRDKKAPLLSYKLIHRKNSFVYLPLISETEQLALLKKYGNGLKGKVLVSETVDLIPELETLYQGAMIFFLKEGDKKTPLINKKLDQVLRLNTSIKFESDGKELKQLL